MYCQIAASESPGHVRHKTHRLPPIVPPNMKEEKQIIAESYVPHSDETSSLLTPHACSLPVVQYVLYVAPFRLTALSLYI